METDHFDQILDQYKRMIHYHIHRLNIRDPHGDFYQEGMLALWEAWKKYGETDTFSKMASIHIRSRLIDLIRKRTRIQDREVMKEFMEEQPFTPIEMEQFDPHFWSSVRAYLTDKQWLFVEKRIIQGYGLAEIAEKEGATIDAVKGWGQAAKRKLRILLKDDDYHL
ncbi:sigma-70 family RNA polymerase sigma factor [Alkalibacillus salilacus]|uniref:RNA polymerase sigma factor (Sigma-70 family) n=1 Tax=Alkalibacillus salilacus TaxID=284582 RepID=A0ABT9VEG6_9BACI|nr:sigma-70 family RNA polymerase sigma factor [Alkalibacillus salilacus]MDQ0159366.1 RNA polymerase sigma factor (sigma-70 family) [Alkalibacillus salilacus]